jgi:valyl-tRNA synthetase
MLANGRRLITKLWNASRFAERHLQDLTAEQFEHTPALLLPTDRWLLHRLAETITEATRELEQGEYAAARTAVERFFWSDLCDNYLELTKARLYRESGPERLAAQWTLAQALLSVIKLFAPYLPFVTEEIYQGLFRTLDDASSLHLSTWPTAQPGWLDRQAEDAGTTLLEILHQVRKYKAEHSLSIGAELATLRLSVSPALRGSLEEVMIDIKGATRARAVTLGEPETSDEADGLRVVVEHRELSV